MSLVQAFKLIQPSTLKLPLVCDSPHSGVVYPNDFDYQIPLSQLRMAEDTHVDQLWLTAPQVGATLLLANLPRTYIDLNRSLHDLDIELMDGLWPQPLQPSEKTRLGYGLIWRKINATTTIYQRKLRVQEVQNRIEQVYLPYHSTLENLVKDCLENFGMVWHLNLHSMPNNAYERLHIHNPAQPLADFVLGDRDGSTCAPEFVNLIETSLRQMGYSVARNDPYKGMALVAKMGQPHKNQHSLQIEIRRPLYMHENTREPNANFPTVQHDLHELLKKIAAYILAKKSSESSE